MDTCCTTLRWMFLFLTCTVSSIGSLLYSIYLILLLAYLSKNWNFAFLIFVPICLTSLVIYIQIHYRDDWTCILLCVTCTIMSIVPTLMCTFTMLTRLAYYHLSPQETIGPKWVLMSLKASIIFFISSALAERKCKYDKFFKDKDAFSRSLPLDFVDIFDMVEILSLGDRDPYIDDDNHASTAQAAHASAVAAVPGISATVPEMSGLEIAIQAFCTTALLGIHVVNYKLHKKYLRRFSGRVASAMESVEESESTQGLKFAIWQNIPFLALRIVIMVMYREFHLGFMVKNLMGIAVCLAPCFACCEHC